MDSTRDISVPIGLVMFDDKFLRIRFADDDSWPPDLKKDASDLQLVKIVSEQIDEWVAGGQMAYEVTPSDPKTLRFWTHVSGLLVHKTRLSEPLPMDLPSTGQDHHFAVMFRDLVSHPQNNPWKA